MKIRMFLIVSATAALLLTGCSSPVRQGINYYHQVAPDVRIGMDKDEALSILAPSAEMMPANEQRPPERFTDQDGRLTEVYFFRSNTYYDDMLTDDEFTPYVFKDDKLSAIGWTALGGPKTQGLPYPRTTYHMGFGYGYHHW